MCDCYIMPEKIGSRVYGGRLGNGPESTGEGFRYRGRRFIQLTGKDNYRAFSHWISVDCVADPDLVANRYAPHSAALFGTCAGSTARVTGTTWSP